MREFENVRARNDLRYSRCSSLHTHTQTFAYAQALRNQHRPLLDSHRYLRNLRQSFDCRKSLCGAWPPSDTCDGLSSTTIHPHRPHDNSWAAVQPYKTHDDLPADFYQALRPDKNLWPTVTEPRRDPATVLAQPLRTLTTILFPSSTQIMYDQAERFLHIF